MRALVTFLAVAAAASAASTASAAPLFYGSSSFVTARSCVTAAPTDPCDGTIFPDQRIFDSVFDGGASSTADALLELADGSASAGQVDFVAGLDLPRLRGRSESSSDTRMNSNQVGYQSFLYSGAAGTAFALTGMLDFDTSGADGPLMGVGPGEGLVTASIFLFDPSVAAGLVTAEDIFNGTFSADCGSAGVIARTDTYTSAGTAAGPQSVSIGLLTDCAGLPIMLTPGDTFLVGATMQTPSNRGGFANAFSTFTLALSDTLSAEERANLEANLISAIDIPAPPALAIFGLGLAMIGSRRRDRRRPRE